MSFGKALEGCSLFYDMKTKEIEYLLRDAGVQEFQGPQEIVKEGEDIHFMGILLNGSATVFLEREEKKIHLQDLNRMDFFGEVIFSNEKKHYYSVETKDDATILFLSFENFQSLYKKWPEAYSIFSMNLLRYEYERMRVSMGLIGRVIQDGSIFVRLPVFGTGKRRNYSNSMREKL